MRKIFISFAIAFACQAPVNLIISEPGGRTSRVNTAYNNIESFAGYIGCNRQPYTQLTFEQKARLSWFAPIDLGDEVMLKSLAEDNHQHIAEFILNRRIPDTTGDPFLCRVYGELCFMMDEIIIKPTNLPEGVEVDSSYPMSTILNGGLTFDRVILLNIKDDPFLYVPTTILNPESWAVLKAILRVFCPAHDEPKVHLFTITPILREQLAPFRVG